MTVGQRDKKPKRIKESKHQKESNKHVYFPNETSTQILFDQSGVKNLDYNELRSRNLSGYAAGYLRKNLNLICSH